MIVVTHKHNHRCGHREPVQKAARPRGWRVLRQFADRVEPKFRDAFLTAINRIRDRATVERLANVLQLGRVDDVLRELGISDQDFARLNARVQQTFQEAAAITAAQLKIENNTFEGRFDITNPNTVQHLRQYSFGLIKQIDKDTREGIRDIVLNAFENGGHPYEQARQIRELIGLLPRQVRAVENFRDALEAEDRDPDQVERMVARYAQRQLNLRARNIARTETIRASSAGQKATWLQAAEAQFLDPQTVKRKWLVTPDDRLCPVCEGIPDLNEDGVPLDGVFNVDFGGKVGIVQIDHPPAHPQCRCTEILSFEDDE